MNLGHRAARASALVGLAGLFFVACEKERPETLPSTPGGKGMEGSGAVAGTGGRTGSGAEAGDANEGGAAGEPATVLGDEQCADGNDNDGDGATDCADDDCAAACGAPCEKPPLLADPVLVEASTVGRTHSLDSDCSPASGPAGPDAVYRFVATHAGYLELELESEKLFTLAVTSTCGSDASSVCASDFLSVPVAEDEELLIVVQSHAPEDAGDFTLRASSREASVCGDGYRDPGEPCDDANPDSLDGCSSECELEASEQEPNTSAAEATPYSDGFYAEITPEGDTDLVSFELLDDGSSAIVSLLGLGNDCQRLATDSLIELHAGNELVPVASDDDSGQGFCSRLVATGLDAGTYYVRISASGATPTFPYRLEVETQSCGDSMLGPGEACDDGDLDSGDGCDSSCQLE